MEVLMICIFGKAIGKFLPPYLVFEDGSISSNGASEVPVRCLGFSTQEDSPKILVTIDQFFKTKDKASVENMAPVLVDYGGETWLMTNHWQPIFLRKTEAATKYAYVGNANKPRPKKIKKGGKNVRAK